MNKNCSDTIGFSGKISNYLKYYAANAYLHPVSA
jgi:hypothetical protein